LFCRQLLVLGFMKDSINILNMKNMRNGFWLDLARKWLSLVKYFYLCIANLDFFSHVLRTIDIKPLRLSQWEKSPKNSLKGCVFV